MNRISEKPTQRLPQSVYARRRRNLLFALIAIIGLAWFVFAQANAPKVEMVTVTVAQGESLWSLAEELAPATQDPRDWIYEVSKLNGLESSDLTPGMTLTVPTPAN
jgi:hypothetical protein